MSALSIGFAREVGLELTEEYVEDAGLTNEPSPFAAQGKDLGETAVSSTPGIMRFGFFFNIATTDHLA